MLRLACLLARKPGLAILEGLIQRPREFQIQEIFTHRLLPKSEDPSRSERPEFSRYQQIAKGARIPLKWADTREEAASLKTQKTDVILSCSWRYHVPASFLSQARYGGINIHRGRLPEYKGAEPVRRALENGDDRVTITGHRMADEIDAGEVLASVDIAVTRRASEPVLAAAERIKSEIVPFYSDVVFASIQNVLQAEHL